MLADELGLDATEGSEVAGPASGADLGRVLAERYVPDQVDLVLYAPVAAGVGGDVLRVGLPGAEAGDQVGGLGAGPGDAGAPFCRRSSRR